jgi:hypothetical protein
MAARKKYSKGASKSVKSAMRRRKRGTLRSGPGGRGGRVTSRKQAVAIGLSEARKKGARVPSRGRRRSKTTRARKARRR